MSGSMKNVMSVCLSVVELHRRVRHLRQYPIAIISHPAFHRFETFSARIS